MRNILIILLLIPLLGSCQSTNKPESDLVNFMIGKNYISKSESKKVENDSLFSSIYDIYLDRYKMQRGETRMLRFSSSEIENKTEKLFNKIYRLDLIEESIFNDIKKKFENRKKQNRLTSETISDELNLFQYLFELEKSELNSESVKNYLKELKRINLIDSNVIFSNNLTSKKDVVKLIKNKLIINLDSLPESINDAYKFAYNEMKKLDENLVISNYSFAIEEKQFADLKYESAVVRFNNSKRNYISNNSYNNDYKESNLYQKLSNQFFRIFNKVLADNESSLRLMDIERMDKNSICIILINENQFKFLKEKDDSRNFTYYDPNWYKVEVSKYWNPFSILSQQETEYYFKIYDSIGLFNHLNEEQIKLELDNLKTTYINSNESILYEVKNICLNFDWEMYDANQPYKKAIEEFALITNGEFKPTNIKDNFSFDKNEAEISFDFKGKTYKTSVEVTGDWYSGEFIELINSAIKDNNLLGGFYYLPDGGQASAHIYLTLNQYNFLKSNNLLEFLKSE